LPIIQVDKEEKWSPGNTGIFHRGIIMRFFKWQSRKTVQAAPAPEKGYGSQRSALFSHLSEHDLSQLYHAATIKHFQKDHCVIGEGDEGNCLYIILEGLVRITYKNNACDSVLHSGDCIGDMAFQEKSVSTYSAIAVEHVTLMEINHSTVDHLPDSIQLMIYKKLSKSFTQNMSYLSTHHDKANIRSTELTAYIRRMKSQTDTFTTSEVFQNIIKNIPKLPKCAGSLSAKLLDDNVSAKEVTESVQEEPALAAAILKTVNSAYYGLTEKMSSLHHAVLYLGFNNVYQLVLENSIKNIMPQDEEYEKIRLHSYMISLIAGEIAAHCQKSKPLVNTTVGILHDVGKIVILLLKRKYPNIKELIHMIDDSKVGACLLRNWGFPESIIKIIECQYDPDFTDPENIGQEYKNEIAILYLAHKCYAIMLEEDNTEIIFIDNFMEVLGIQKKDCQTFYQNVILPALLKNKKRLPERISSLVHEQTLKQYPARAYAS
jgi:HD-like signal output (HDOD) protein/CRP-like cAMP-binding protein